MASKKLKLAILFLIPSLCFWSHRNIVFPNKVLAASTYYVATNGNDTNPGTQPSPWKTIQKAANTMNTGDTVTVLAGSYANERVQVTKSGSSGSPITYQAQGTAVMKGFKITANYITIKGFEITNTDYVRWHMDISAGVYVKGSNVIIENNYIHDCSLGGIELYGTPSESTVTSNCIVRNNRLYHNEMVGIGVAGRNNLIEGNEIWGTVQCHPAVVAVEGPNCPDYPAVRGLDADGMRFFGQGHIFRKNYIHDIKFGPPGINPSIGDYIDNAHIDCFQTWSGSDTEPATNILFEQNKCIVPEFNTANPSVEEAGHGFMLGGASNLTFKNNIIKAYRGINTGAGGNSYLTILNNNWIGDLNICSGTYCWPGGVGLSNTPYSIVKNNIFYDNRYSTIGISGTSLTGLDRDYNLAYRSDGATPAGTPVAHDKWGVNPKFVNPNNNDFHLQADSPCINTGVTVSTVTNDYDGNLRPQGAGFDIGAFEYTGATPPTSTPIPGDVNLDGHVNMADYAIMVEKYGVNYPSCDFNHNGTVDMGDYSVLVANYGKY